MLRDIASGRNLRGRELDRAREDSAASQYSTAATIAGNAGLDIFYIVGGILFFVIADQMTPDLAVARGAMRIAMTAQGTGLLAFDMTTWIAAAQRGDATRELFRDPEGAANIGANLVEQEGRSTSRKKPSWWPPPKVGTSMKGLLGHGEARACGQQEASRARAESD